MFKTTSTVSQCYKSGLHRQACPAGLCRPRHRLGADADPPCRHPSDQPICQPSAQHWPGSIRRRVGVGTALAVLGHADCWRDWSTAGSKKKNDSSRRDENEERRDDLCAFGISEFRHFAVLIACFNLSSPKMPWRAWPGKSSLRNHFLFHCLPPPQHYLFFIHIH